MGGCASVNNSTNNVKSSTKSKANNNTHFSKLTPNSLPLPLPLPQLTHPLPGSKEETFFDSQAYLESDIEDDFYSVNGDFTPSCGSTPNYQRSVPGTPFTKSTFSFERVFAPKPPKSPGIGKKLGELFKESIDDEQVADKQTKNIDTKTLSKVLNDDKNDYKMPPKSLQGTPYKSGSNSVCSTCPTTPSKDAKAERKKCTKSNQCCMPRFIPSLSFNDRKKMASPGGYSGG